MSIEQHGSAPAEEAPPRTPLSLVKGDTPPRPEVDTTAPILPLWLRDRLTFTTTLRNWAKRNAYRSGKWGLHLPAMAALLVLYSPRGLGRVVARLAVWVYDQDSAELRHQHAGNRDSGEYARVHSVRRANLHARMLVFATAAAVLVGPVLAWTSPYVLSAIVGAIVTFWTIKVIPGRDPWEIVAAVAAGAATWWFLPEALALLPRPPAWAAWAAGVLAVLILGWIGRPEGKKMIHDETLGEGIVMPVKAPMVREALCQLGISGMKDPGEIRLLMDVHRHGPGVQVDLELPGGVAAAEVVKRREKLAAAMKRELGCVWPSVGRRHAAHLALYVCDLPMVEAPQKPWPLADGDPVDIFKALPLVTDQRGEWVKLVLAYASVVIGAQPRMGKTFFLRELLLVAGLDARTKVASFDGKGTGDLAPTRLFAHFYSVGDDAEEVEVRVLRFLRELRDEMRRRAKFIRDLPYEEAPESKVTSALVDRYPARLAPWVLGFDETQSYFGYGDKNNKNHKAIREEIAAIVTDLVKRGPALGIWVCLATQNVSEETIPRQISLNAVIRAALKLFDDSANNMVLGAGAYGKGVDATQFDFSDKGLMWLRGDGDQPFIGRSVAGLDAPASERIAALARALREKAGTLSGDAAGEEAAEEALQVDLLADCREAFGGSRAMLLGELREALTARRSETWAHLDNAALGSMLNQAGVRRGTVYSTALKLEGYGVKREWLDVAATADEDPDEGDDAA